MAGKLVNLGCRKIVHYIIYRQSPHSDVVETVKWAVWQLGLPLSAEGAASRQVAGKETCHPCTSLLYVKTGWADFDFLPNFDNR